MFILCPASLHPTWDDELLNHKLGLNENENIDLIILNLFIMILHLPIKKFKAINESDSSKNIFVFDSSALINNVYNNIISKQHK